MASQPYVQRMTGSCSPVVLLTRVPLNLVCKVSTFGATANLCYQQPENVSADCTEAWCTSPAAAGTASLQVQTLKSLAQVLARQRDSRCSLQQWLAAVHKQLLGQSFPFKHKV